MPRFASTLLLMLFVGLSPCLSFAAEKTSTGKPAGPSGATQATAPAVPDPYKLNLLIRTTVIALNQANMTGNYSVLRDLAAPGFQSVNSPARLAEIFASLRKRNLDLSPVMFFDPKLVRPPIIQPNGLLRLSGFFNTRPEQVHFDLAFQFVNGQWRLFGISLETKRVEVAARGTDIAARSSLPTTKSLPDAASRPQGLKAVPPPERQGDTGSRGSGASGRPASGRDKGTVAEPAAKPPAKPSLQSWSSEVRQAAEQPAQAR